jgi:hypothetical protein
MSQAIASDSITIKISEFETLLRKVVREIVHEELARFAMTNAEEWEIEEGSPLWQDLIELKKEMRAGGVTLLTHKEVFGE